VKAEAGGVMPSISALLGAIILSLLAAFLFRVFLITPADATREYLAKQRSGWRRKRYVRIFVEAVRGQAKIDEAILLFRVSYFIPLMLVFFGTALLLESFHSTRFANQMIKQYENALRNEVSVVQQPAENPLQAAIRAMNDEKRKMVVAWWSGLAVTALSALWFFWLLVFRLPFVVFRNRFSYELDRFTLRIQGLASKAELAELIKREAEVTDEQSARAFVDVIARIADRHGVRPLVDTFLLWGTPASDNATVIAEPLKSVT
jgi:hypothetical protein